MLKADEKKGCQLKMEEKDLNMLEVQKGALLYEGKGKKIFEVLNSKDQVLVFFKDDLTAYQAKKRGSFKDKGKICKKVSLLVFKYLKKEGIENHFIRDINTQEMLCLKTRILPLEVVIRNTLAGSTAKRLGLKEGLSIKTPLLEFYYKRDDLDDPLISEEHIEKLNLIEDSSFLEPIKKQAFLINEKLKSFFSKAGLKLVDFKMEFGLFQGKLMLADEISPDSCRIWDEKTGERLDKDRFRRDWGKVEESYKDIETRLSKTWKEFC